MDEGEVDASSLAIEISLEEGAELENTSWLQPADDVQYIKLADLDTLTKKINLALIWKARVLHMHTYSSCVYHWVSDTRK